MNRPLWLILPLLLLPLAVVSLSGCKPKPPVQSSSEILDTVAPTRSNLDQAYDMLARIEEFERGPATQSVVSFLNNYLSEQKGSKDWQPDALVSRLPRSLRQMPPVQQLGLLDVNPSDTQYMEEAIVYRRAGEWILRGKVPEDLSAWLEAQENLTPEGAADLASAWLLFDWSVRNIQLDPLREQPRELVGPTGQAGEVAIPASLRGIPGPGYTARPWHVAMTGHGDAWQRMRVFHALLRQQGIEVVLLARSVGNDNIPWVSAVLIGDNLYLFDASIGLPIPGPGGKGIATYAQVRDDGSLLRQLDVDSDNLYDVAADEVKNVTVLLDAPLESLSQRMAILEQGLAGERQLRLTTQPSELATRLRKLPGISGVALWTVPIDALLFEAALQESPEFDPQLRGQIMDERFLLENRTPIAEARIKHLRGQFTSVPGDDGAKSLYLRSRVPDAEIDNLADSQRMQAELGLTPYLERAKSAEERAQLIDATRVRLRRAKHNCSYWLGLSHYETGSFETALNWFDERTLQASPDGFWTAGARYNLGRTYEALQAPSLAQEFYVADDSPQQHGSLLRAKRLQQRINAAAQKQ